MLGGFGGLLVGEEWRQRKVVVEGLDSVAKVWPPFVTGCQVEVGQYVFFHITKHFTFHRFH